MLVGTILLSKDYKYIDENGNLPKRPKFDKQFLATLIKGHKVSEEGYKLLPSSLQKLVMVDTPITMPITIKELAKSDLLIVVKSPEVLKNGKEFRLDSFKLLRKERTIELWIKK